MAYRCFATEKYRWISGTEGMMGEAEEARGGVLGVAFVPTFSQGSIPQ